MIFSIFQAYQQDKNTESEFSEFEFSKILLQFGNTKMLSNTDNRYLRKVI